MVLVLVSAEVAERYAKLYPEVVLVEVICLELEKSVVELA